MTAMDSPRYEAAYADLCACYRQKLTLEHVAQRDAWWRKLAPTYEIDVVVAAFDAAPRMSKAYFPNLGHLFAAIAEVQADRGGIRHTESRTRYYQDAAGVTQAEYGCYVCCDTGFHAKLRATGEVVTGEEMQARRMLPRDDPRYLATDAYAMVRCVCRGQARQAGAA